MVYSDWWSSEPVSEGVSSCCPLFLWTLRCLRRFETTENWRPHPSTSQEKATLDVSHNYPPEFAE